MRVTKLMKQSVNTVRDALSDGEATMMATDLLEMQHRKTEMLFARIGRSRSDAGKRELVNELADNLAAHMMMEEEVFYPACARALKKDEGLVPESFEEHAVARFAMERLVGTRADAKTFDARVKVLMELVEQHVREEEDELLPKVKRAMGREKLEALGAEMRERFEQLVKAGHKKVMAGTAPAAAKRGATRRTTATAAKRAAAKRAAAKRGGAKRAKR